MKGLVISLIVLVIIGAFADLSRAAEDTYYAGKVIDCQAGKRITIKDADGNNLTFKIIGTTIDGKKIRSSNISEWKKCSIGRESIWLVARGDTARYASELPEGLTVQQIAKKIKDIRQQAVSNLVKEGTPTSEVQIVNEGYALATKEYLANFLKVTREAKDYFWWLFMEYL